MDDRAPLLAGIFVLLVSCTAADRQLIEVEAAQDLGPAKACLVRELSMGELADPLAIVQACKGSTILGLSTLTEEILASAIDASVPSEPDTGAALSTRAVRLARLTTLRNQCRVQLLEGGGVDGGGG